MSAVTVQKERIARKRLEGRVALITGGTSGIGRAIAAGFAAEGARVVASGRNRQRGATLLGEIEAAGGDGAFFAADLTTAAACDQLVADTVDRFGKLDILVNSAGVFPLAPSHEVTEEDFHRTIDANLKSAFFCGQAAIRHLLARGQGGRIINLASIAGLIGFPTTAIYSATKAAMIGLTQVWAVEYAPSHINVNAIAPGNIETPMNEGLRADPDYLANLIANTPAGRNGQTSDIVPTAILLASDEGDFFCGATLVIDGGWVVR